MQRQKAETKSIVALKTTGWVAALQSLLFKVFKSIFKTNGQQEKLEAPHPRLGSSQVVTVEMVQLALAKTEQLQFHFLCKPPPVSWQWETELTTVTAL